MKLKPNGRLILKKSYLINFSHRAYETPEEYLAFKIKIYLTVNV